MPAHLAFSVYGLTPLLAGLFLLVFFGGLVACFIPKLRRKAVWTMVGSVLGVVISLFLFMQAADQRARQKGFASLTDYQVAEDAGITDSEEWRARQFREREAREAFRKPPDDQIEFMQVVEQGREEATRGQNDLQRGAARPSRARKLCALMRGLGINGWIGRIAGLSTNNEGKGVVKIKLAEKLHLGTWNNVLSDIGDHTLIQPKAGSPLGESGLMRDGRNSLHS